MGMTLLGRDVEISPSWVIVDAAGKTLGRVASRVAHYLRGKHRPDFTPYIACGAAVVVTNVAKVVLTGRKAERKHRYTHSGRPGGLKKKPWGEVLAERPERLFEEAVSGMLPKNKLGRRMFRRLHVYAGAEHPHGAQRPAAVEP